MRIALAVLLACAAPALSRANECAEGREMDDEGNCVRDDGQITGGGTSLGGVGLGSGSGESKRPSDSIYQSAATGGGGGGAARAAGCDKLPRELLELQFARHPSFRSPSLRKDPNGHAVLPVGRLPAGHKIGFRAVEPRGGRLGGSSISIGWSPYLGLEHPVNCGWTVWIGAGEDPSPVSCQCLTGAVLARADIPVARPYYSTPFPEGADAKKLRERSCILEGGKDYFFYFAATGDASSRRCATMLVNNGGIGSVPSGSGAPPARTR